MSHALIKQPLYSQVADVLAQRVADGVWKPGSSLPNEQDLAREMGVSVGTMRKALDRLEANRLVTRLQGRGTFVEDHSKDAYASRFERFRDMGGGNLELESRILAQEPGEADPTEQARLELRSPQGVLRTTRVRLRGNKPFLYETAVLATSRFPALNGNPYGDYQLGAFAQRHGVLLGQAEEHLTLSEAGGDAVGLLDVEPGTILLRLDRIVRSLTGEPVEWRVGLCPLRDEQYVVSMN